MSDDAIASLDPMRDATRVVHAGLAEPVAGEPFLPGPTLAAVYHAPGEPDAIPFTCGRYGNPTWEHYERAIGSLEGGTAVVFSSGMAAVSAVLLSLLEPGDTLTLASDAYDTTRQLALEYLRPRGIEVRTAPTAGRALYDLLPGTRLLWLETPSNPRLDVCDIAELAGHAHAHGAVVAVDNTLATALGQLPLELGADYSVSSATKQVRGHSDLVLGYVTAADTTRAGAIRAWRRLAGSIPGRTRCGWRTARWRRSTCASAGSARTRSAWPSSWLRGPTSSACAILACRPTTPTSSRAARCGSSAAS
jgi:cystathionine gamma-lyase